jgi:hypothetical protein
MAMTESAIAHLSQAGDLWAMKGQGGVLDDGRSHEPQHEPDALLR